MKQPIISHLHAGVADEYARCIYDELRHKPLDQQLLDRFAERLQVGRFAISALGPATSPTICMIAAQTFAASISRRKWLNALAV